MAKTGSYIKLDRGLKTNSLWLEKPFSKGQAWVDLLLLAQGVETDKQYRGQIQRMEPGTVYTSIRYLEKRWGWSRNKVYRFLELLVKEKMIAVKGWNGRNIATEHSDGTQNETKNGTTNGTIVTIENWALYQYRATNNGTNNETQNGTGERNRGTEHTIESNNKRKQYKRKYPPKSPQGGTTPPGEIPEMYKDQFESYEDYLSWRNQ